MRLLELDNLIAALKQAGKFKPDLTINEGQQIRKEIRKNEEENSK